MEQLNHSPEQGTYIEMDAWITDYLKSASKWAKFLCIMGFIMVGFMLIGTTIAMAYAANAYAAAGINPGTNYYLMMLLGIVVLLLYILPIYYLLRFSGRIKAAMNQQSQEQMEEAFVFLHKHYRLFFILFAANFLLISILIPLIIKAVQS